jgi:hypothetical protein
VTTRADRHDDRPRVTLALATLIAAASAAVVVWRVAHIAVLLDLSYVLNNAQRIASGDVPYRDFALPYPPLTFVVQAVLIRIAGAHYLVASAYAVALDALAVALAVFIVYRIVGRPMVAASICAPLAVLGVHDIFPHPFYDADASALMLAAIAATLWALDARTRVPWLVAGASLPLPLLAKQNLGVAFLALMVTALAVTLLRERRRAELGVALVGVALTVAASAVVLQLTAGLARVVASTVVLASARLAASAPPLAWLADLGAAAAVALTLAGFVAYRRSVGAWRASALAAVVTPYAFVAGLELAAPRSDAILTLWPLGMLLGCAAGALAALRGRATFVSFLPFVCAGVATAAFLSQGVAGSSYALWPLLAVAFAVAVREARDVTLGASPLRSIAIPAAGLLVLVAGAAYVRADTRLSFLRLDGAVQTSAFPALAGLSAPGTFVGDLDAALAYLAARVPADDELIAFPGEDPVHFALGRRTRFPVLQFDPTTDPYTPTELRALRDATGVRWIFVKRELQAPAIPNLASNEAALTEGFDLVGTAGAYAVYRRP